MVGLQQVDVHMKRALGTLTDWDTFQRMTEQEVVEKAEAYKAGL